MDEHEKVPEEQGKSMSKRLSLEVALLSMHLGWTEHEILSLPSIRRQTYVEILSDLCGGFEEALRMGATNRVGVEKLLREYLMHSLDKAVSNKAADTP